jgi:alkyl hydroperoxide reductase subunit AhpF
MKMAERLLDDNVSSQVKEYFGQLDKPVQLLFFGSKSDCTTCDDTLQLVKEVSELSDKLDLKVYDIEADAEIAKQHNVNKAPGLVLVGKDGDKITDFGVRYSGIPAGHEFNSLINDLLMVSKGTSGLSDTTKAFLHSLTDPLLFLVFTTPT